jgi:hypothetical protein
MGRLSRQSWIPARAVSVLWALSLVFVVVGNSWGQTVTQAAPGTDNVKSAEKASLATETELKAIADIKSHSEIMTNLTYLSDVIGPRLTSTPALKKANDWTAEKMKAYGLTNVHLESWTLPEGWERGSASGRVIEPDNQRTLQIASNAWSPGTNGKIEGDVVAISGSSPSWILIRANSRGQ